MLNKISFDEIRKVIDVQILDLLNNAISCENDYLWANSKMYICSAIELTKAVYNLGAIDRYDFFTITSSLYDFMNNVGHIKY